MKFIHVALAEDNRILRNGLELIIQDNPKLKILYTAENGSEIIEKTNLAEKLPDVILMDIDMPIFNGFEATKEILKKFPQINIIFLTSHINLPFIEMAIHAGGNGYLSKDAEVDEIFEAIQEVYEKGYYFNELIRFDLIKTFLEKGKLKHTIDFGIHFSPRELDYIRLLCQEKTDQEIADELYISVLSAETYRKNILKKIGVKKSIGVAIYAVKNGLI